MSLYLGENKIADNTCSRNIGEIVASTIPLSDAGLHLLDGAVINGAGSYAKFVNYIAGLVSNYPDLFTTEANWQSSVSTYGVCGKFVYDSTNNTVRLPKITGFTEGTTDVTALGDLVEAGLPNIKSNGTITRGNTWTSNGSTITSGAFQGTASQYYYNITNDSSGNHDRFFDFNMDASRSSSIYGNSSTVQPQSIKVLYYIVIASSITNELNLDVADMATKSLDNLDNDGKNIANWSNNVTNCITEIPQDIKLELNNGTLTLKAGSKVYIPNGFESDGTTLKFDEIIVESDMQAVIPDSNRNGTFLTYNVNGRGQNMYHWSQWNSTDIYSGPTAPSASGNKIWYDTTNNVIKEMNDGANWTILNTSFPFCTFSGTSTVVTSIDQVFNGFGYIGSTVFALPGVKGLIPNGRNADGSLKSIEFTTSSVLSETYPSGHTFNNLWFSLNATSLSAIDGVDCTYNEEQNILYNVSTAVSKVICATGADSNGKITAFYPKNPFHALDYSDSSIISGWSMPSSRYIDLTLGASGGTYTAPANGWFCLSKKTNGTNQVVNLINSNSTGSGIRTAVRSPISGDDMYIYLPAKKGDTITSYYSAGGTTEFFRFIYAQGAI